MISILEYYVKHPNFFCQINIIDARSCNLACFFTVSLFVCVMLLAFLLCLWLYKNTLLLQTPELFTTPPALAIPKAISKAGLQTSQVDYYEINEAFSLCF
jgi:hypothetical protein